jgi:hypothetical protein
MMEKFRMREGFMDQSFSDHVLGTHSKGWMKPANEHLPGFPPE